MKRFVLFFVAALIVFSLIPANTVSAATVPVYYNSYTDMRDNYGVSDWSSTCFTCSAAMVISSKGISGATPYDIWKLNGNTSYVTSWQRVCNAYGVTTQSGWLGGSATDVKNAIISLCKSHPEGIMVMGTCDNGGDHAVVAFIDDYNNVYFHDPGYYGWSSRQIGVHDFMFSSYTQFTQYRVFNGGNVAPVDIGTDFYGIILNTAAWKPITVGSDGFVTMQKEIGHASQVWKFTRQADNSYVIESALNGKALEMHQGNTTAGTPVATADKYGGYYFQRWFIYPYGNGYVLASAHHGDLVLDMFNNDSSDGMEITTYPRNNTGAQVWSINKQDDVQLKSPTLTVSAKNDKTSTTFTWNEVYGESTYTVYIWKDKCDYLAADYMIENAKSGCTKTLPAGKYEALVIANNAFTSASSKVVSFSVASTCTHNWTSSVKAATCTEPAVTTYKCSLCGETKTEKAELKWSGWSATYPNQGIRVQYKDQYRYADRKPNWSEAKTYSIEYAAQWPAGFDTNNQYYSQYNKTPATAGETATAKTTVVSNEHVGYIYWHWCRGTYWNGPDNRAISDCREGEFQAFHAFPTSSDSAGTSSYGDHKFVNGSCCVDSYWWHRIPVYRQTYTVQTLQHTGDQWTDWSSWSDDKIEATNDRKVETRRVYRYLTEGLADHTWDEGTVTKAPTETETGVRTHKCTVCGATGTTTIPSANSATNPFVDVPKDKYYHDAVLWAFQNNITTGKDATHFDPSGKCTRAQVVTFLWRAAGEPAPRSLNNPFPDVSDNKYYYKAVLWAVEQGITNGFKDGSFGPNKSCTRAQIVTFLWRYANEPAPNNMNNTFPDVNIGAYYGKAVLWAVENGITTGYKDGSFGPDKTCTRDQIVTFLYRYIN